MTRSRIAVPATSVVGGSVVASGLGTTVVQAQPPITQNFFVPASGGGGSYGNGFGLLERQQLGTRLNEQLELERQRLQRRTNELLEAQINLQQQFAPQQQLQAQSQFDSTQFQTMFAAFLAAQQRSSQQLPLQQLPQQPCPQQDQPRPGPSVQQQQCEQPRTAQIQQLPEPRRRLNLQCEIVPDGQRRTERLEQLPQLDAGGNRSVVQSVCARCHGATLQRGGIRFDRDISPQLALRARTAIANGSMPPQEVAPLSDPDKFLGMIEFLDIEQKRDLFRSLSQ